MLLKLHLKNKNNVNNCETIIVNIEFFLFINNVRTQNWKFNYVVCYSQLFAASRLDVASYHTQQQHHLREASWTKLFIPVLLEKDSRQSPTKKTTATPHQHHESGAPSFTTKTLCPLLFLFFNVILLTWFFKTIIVKHFR